MNDINFTTWFGLIGVTLLLACALLKLLLTLNVDKKIAYIVSLMAFVIAFVPYSGYSISLYLRGFFNDLSITTVMLLLFYLFKPEQPKQQSLYFYLIVAFTGLLLYPMSLGLGPVDPYGWGYFSAQTNLLSAIIFIVILAFILILSYIKRYSLLLIILVTTLLAWQLKLLESHNLWDYLIDPLVWLYALYVSFKMLVIQSVRPRAE
jgi:hypothetical protein